MLAAMLSHVAAAQAPTTSGGTAQQGSTPEANSQSTNSTTPPTTDSGTTQAPAPAAGTQTTTTTTTTSTTTKQDAPPAASAPAASGTPAADPSKTLPVQSTYDEVHVKPRESEKKEATPAFPNVPTAADVDPSTGIKTRTKPMRVDVDLVLIPVTVTDPMNRLVTGLEKENFALWDNGEKQEVKHFSSEDAPISLGVIFDMSGSMNNKIDKAKEAVV